jgi:3-isopropylmalate dehydrogenase
MLFDWQAARHRRPEFEQAAKAIEAAIDASLQNPATRTPDLGGKLGTKAFTRQVANLIGWEIAGHAPEISITGPYSTI